MVTFTAYIHLVHIQSIWDDNILNKGSTGRRPNLEWRLKELKTNSFSVTFQFVFPGYHFWLQFLLKCLRCAGCSWRWRKINRSCSWRCFYRFRKWQIKWYEVVIQYVVDRLRNMMEITWYGWHILKWSLDILDKLPS